MSSWAAGELMCFRWLQTRASTTDQATACSTPLTSSVRGATYTCTCTCCRNVLSIPPTLLPVHSFCEQTFILCTNLASRTTCAYQTAYVSLSIVLSPTVIILKQALAYFPVFACVDAPIPVLSHCIGFLYTCLMYVYTCSSPPF